MTYYFYDTETSGVNPREARVMQFGGQRTDKNLQPIGGPDNFIIKLTPDVLPDPDAILTHGITPQKTIEDGITEAEFFKLFNQQIATADTIFVGFNNIRFDDEFIRFGLWRNFYDAYEWQWKEGAGRWDLLDVVRMTRALRPDGIVWPQKDADNRLEILAKINKLKHADAHDALSDVKVLIDLTRLLRDKQPKLFDYLLNLRDKKKLEPFIKAGSPFVYTSGKYPKETLHTTIATVVDDHPKKSGVFVYDLRIDPTPFLKLSADELAELWRYKPWKTDAERPPRFPLKELAFNKCPAVAPLSVLDEPSRGRLQLNMDEVEANFKKLSGAKGFGAKLIEAWRKLYPEAKPTAKINELTVDSQLYDGFIADADRIKMRAVRAAQPEELTEFISDFNDERLKVLLPLYKARNYPRSLSAEEQAAWENFCTRKLSLGGEQSRANKIFNRLAQLKAEPSLNNQQRYLLE